MNKKFILYIYLIILSFVSCKKSDEKKIPVETESSRISMIKDYKSRIDSINKSKNWTVTSYGLWKSNDGNLGLKTEEGTENGIEITKYITELTDGRSLVDVIDTTSFKYVGSSFYKDKNHVYTHYAMADGGNFWIVDNADTKSFEIVGDCYAKDKNNIFTERNMNTDTIFDYRSFRSCKDCGCFAKDKNGYYFWDQRLNLQEIDDEEIKKNIEKLKKL